MRVFVLIDCYLPGYKHGGQIRTLANLVAAMPAEYEFFIFTGDRDRGDDRPYNDVKRDAWNDVGRARVFYASPGIGALSRLRSLLMEVRPDVVYSNSLFSRTNVGFMVARRFGLVPPVPFVLAPRGELSPGALGLKHLKKQTFLRFAGRVRLFDRVTWQASTEVERRDIEVALADVTSVARTRIRVAADPVLSFAGVPDEAHRKAEGAANLVFLSRVCRQKNLVLALDALRDVHGVVTLDVYGPRDDPDYWIECERAIARLPDNVRVKYCGPVAPARVHSVLASHDFFVLPTRGENFGHVIYEALSAACPVVVSDATAWSQVASNGAGWCLPLHERSAWVRVLQQCVDMGPREHGVMRRRACEVRPVGGQNAIQENVDLLRAGAQG